jgi:glycosyltransferase involved in cell wall biosynthesis
MNLGGPSRQIALLHGHLGIPDSDHILAIGNVSEFESEADVSFARNVHRIKTLKRGINPFLDLASILKLIRIIRTENPDIIHTHLSKAWVLGLIANKLTGNRSVLIHTFHGHTLLGYFQGYLAKLLLEIQKRASSSTDFLIAVGERVRADLINSKIGSLEKFYVIYPGVFTERAIRHKSEKENKIKLLYVGRLEQVKQPESLIQICRELESLSCSYELNIVGEGSLFEKLQNLAQKEKLQIVFHGWQQEIDNFFYEADLLLLCSINEGTPIVVAEAATFELPAMTTNVGAVQEMITNDLSGFILAETSMFAAKIDSLSKNRVALKSVGLQAKLDMSEKFGLSQFISAHQDVYSRALRLKLKKEAK